MTLKQLEQQVYQKYSVLKGRLKKKKNIKPYLVAHFFQIHFLSRTLSFETHILSAGDLIFKRKTSIFSYLVLLQRSTGLTKIRYFIPF